MNTTFIAELILSLRRAKSTPRTLFSELVITKMYKKALGNYVKEYTNLMGLRRPSLEDKEKYSTPP